MDMNLLVLFIALNVVNVIIQTIKSLVTVKCGKLPAALVNALAYGFYTIVVVYMVCELPLMLKVLVVGLCNLVGVFVVKWAEEIMRKDKLWLVKITVPSDRFNETRQALKDIPNTYFNLNKYIVFDCYCASQKQTSKVLEICKNNGGKAFATENRLSY